MHRCSESVCRSSQVISASSNQKRVYPGTLSPLSGTVRNQVVCTPRLSADWPKNHRTHFGRKPHRVQLSLAIGRSEVPILVTGVPGSGQFCTQKWSYFPGARRSKTRRTTRVPHIPARYTMYRTSLISLLRILTRGPGPLS